MNSLNLIVSFSRLCFILPTWNVISFTNLAQILFILIMIIEKEQERETGIWMEYTAVCILSGLLSSFSCWKRALSRMQTYLEWNISLFLFVYFQNFNIFPVSHRVIVQMAILVIVHQWLYFCRCCPFYYYYILYDISEQSLNSKSTVTHTFTQYRKLLLESFMNNGWTFERNIVVLSTSTFAPLRCVVIYYHFYYCLSSSSFMNIVDMTIATAAEKTTVYAT